MTQRIQVPTISRDLVRALELTASPELELDPLVTPVIIVGGSEAAKVATGLASFYSPAPASTATRVPDLYAQVFEVNAGVGVTGYSALVNDSGDRVYRITRVKASAPAAQEFGLHTYQPGHGMVAGIASTRRDTRALVPTALSNAFSNAASRPGGSFTVEATAPTVSWDFAGCELVLGPGAAALVNVVAFAQRYIVSWSFESYRS